LSDIDQIEGLDYSYDEFKDVTLIHTSYPGFYLIEGNETYTARMDAFFTGKVLSNKHPTIWFTVLGLDEYDYEKELIILYDGKRLRKEDKRYKSWGLFKMTPGEIQSLAEADTIKVQVEYGNSGLFSNEAIEYLNLFYQAVILGNWESMIEPDTVEIEAE